MIDVENRGCFLKLQLLWFIWLCLVSKYNGFTATKSCNSYLFPHNFFYFYNLYFSRGPITIIWIGFLCDDAWNTRVYCMTQSTYRWWKGFVSMMTVAFFFFNAKRRGDMKEKAKYCWDKFVEKYWFSFCVMSTETPKVGGYLRG